MMKRIDAHHHLWDLSAVDYPWLQAQGVRRFFGDPTPIQRDYLLSEFSTDAARHGIAGSVHIQVGAADPLAEAQWVDAIARANPHWPMAQVAFCDLTSDRVDADLDALAALPSVRGVRQIVGRAPEEDAASGTNDLLDDSAFLNGLRKLAGRGMGFDLQLIPELMVRTAAVLQQVPELSVALCHAGSPHDRSSAGIATWRQSLGALAALPNITCKLSGLGMFEHDWTVPSFRPLVGACLDLFGPQRCMFGSNFPVDSLSSSYQRLFEAYELLLADLTVNERDRVFGGTAAAFYRLKVD